MLPCTLAVELNYCGKVFSFLDPKESTNSGCAGKVASALLKKKEDYKYQTICDFQRIYSDSCSEKLLHLPKFQNALQ